MASDLDTCLEDLERDPRYRVVRVLKAGDLERTDLVVRKDANGRDEDLFVRKVFASECGLGGAYERLWEAQGAGRRFAHLPRIEECLEVGSALVVVMEYVRGDTLEELARTLNPGVALARMVFPSLCQAVRELHEGFDPPLVHRDLKPSNVMLRGGEVVIIDLGIARTFHEGAEADTQHFGTRSYAPPEQFGYGQTDERSDVFAMGALLYFLLTGGHPGPRERDRAFAHNKVPEPLRLLICRACAFDPQERYESVAQMQAAFESASAAVQEEKTPGRRLLERVLLVLSVLWNALIVCLLVGYFVIMVQDVAAPAADDVFADYPLALRALANMLVYLLVFAPITLLFRSRHLERTLAPKARRWGIGREIVACAVLFAACIAALVVVQVAVG